MAVLAATLLLIAGCSTTTPQRDDGSTIPWNAPEDWERQPNTGAPFAW